MQGSVNMHASLYYTSTGMLLGPVLKPKSFKKTWNIFFWDNFERKAGKRVLDE
jgi:hypothetical protein